MCLFVEQLLEAVQSIVAAGMFVAAFGHFSSSNSGYLMASMRSSITGRRPITRRRISNRCPVSPPGLRHETNAQGLTRLGCLEPATADRVDV
jgi:hypothetical protein